MELESESVAQSASASSPAPATSLKKEGLQTKSLKRDRSRRGALYSKTKSLEDLTGSNLELLKSERRKSFNRYGLHQIRPSSNIPHKKRDSDGSISNESWTNVAEFDEHMRKLDSNDFNVGDLYEPFPSLPRSVIKKNTASNKIDEEEGEISSSDEEQQQTTESNDEEKANVKQPKSKSFSEIVWPSSSKDEGNTLVHQIVSRKSFSAFRTYAKAASNLCVKVDSLNDLEEDQLIEAFTKTIFSKKLI